MLESATFLIKRNEMTDPRRKAIAYIAGTYLSNTVPSAVFDYQSTTFTYMSGTVGSRNISVYDFDRNCHIGGNLADNKFSLYDFGDHCHLNIEFTKDGKFNGYDFGSHSHFSGTVTNKSINIFDFQMSRHFNYSV